MRFNAITCALVTGLLGSGLALPSLTYADFIKDSKASLELRNFYFNRDHRQGGDRHAKPSKNEEWAQGFLFRFESGYTEGTVGFGLDAMGLLGLKLDSSPDRSGSGLLKRSRHDQRAHDEYGELGVTAKVRVSKSTLKLGTLEPRLPVVMRHDSRILPQTFAGGILNSQEIDGLNIDIGRLKKVNQRDSSDNEDMTINTAGKRHIDLSRAPSGTDQFDIAGASYEWTKNLKTSYYFGKLDDFYKQHYLNLVHVWPFAANQSIKSDIRWARSLDDGKTNVDNRAFNAMFTYKLNNHGFSAAYQKMSGDTGFAYINGTDPFLVNFVQVSDFGNKDEKSWQVRYDYNFADLGLPGLTFLTRYLSGDNIDLGAGQKHGKEWERDIDITYVVQSGPLKNVSLRWRNAMVRTNYSKDYDENRLIIGYTLPLW